VKPSNSLKDALIQTGAKIVDDALKQVNEQVSEELMKPEYTRGTRVSDLKATIVANVPMDLQIRMSGGTIIDTDATVIDDNTKVLPVPKEGKS